MRSSWLLFVGAAAVFGYGSPDVSSSKSNINGSPSKAKEEKERQRQERAETQLGELREAIAKDYHDASAADFYDYAFSSDTYVKMEAQSYAECAALSAIEVRT